MTKQEILVNYQNALACAEKIDAVAKRLHSIRIEGVGTAKEDMKMAWTGDKADGCERKILLFCEESESQEKAIQKLAEALRKMARNFYIAEMTALKISEVRSH